MTFYVPICPRDQENLSKVTRPFPGWEGSGNETTIYGVGHDHVCAIFADSAPSNVCEFPIIGDRGISAGNLLGSLWFIGRSEREVYGDHKNRFNLGSTALRFLARAA